MSTLVVLGDYPRQPPRLSPLVFVVSGSRDSSGEEAKTFQVSGKVRVDVTEKRGEIFHHEVDAYGYVQGRYP